jgi:hypothetical protein
MEGDGQIWPICSRVSVPSRLTLTLTEVPDWKGFVLSCMDRRAFFDKFQESHAVQYFYEPFLQTFDPELEKNRTFGTRRRNQLFMALYQIEVGALTGQLDWVLTHFWYGGVDIEWLRSETAPCILKILSGSACSRELEESNREDRLSPAACFSARNAFRGKRVFRSCLNGQLQRRNPILHHCAHFP